MHLQVMPTISSKRIFDHQHHSQHSVPTQKMPGYMRKKNE